MSRALFVFAGVVAFVVTFEAYSADDTPGRRSIRTILKAAHIKVDSVDSTSSFGSRRVVDQFSLTNQEWARVTEFFQDELTKVDTLPWNIQPLMDGYQVPDAETVKLCEIYVANEDSQSFLKTPSFSSAAFFWDKSTKTVYFVFAYAYG